MLAWNPDIVIVKMGTNDAKAQNWAYKDNFESDYIEFILSFQTLPVIRKSLFVIPFQRLKIISFL